MKSFFDTLSKSLDEAARIDGASRMRVLLHILLPLVVPGLVAVGIYTFLNAWDDYLMALTIMKSNEMRTAPVGIAQSFLGEYSNDYGGLMAFAVAGSLPIVLLFIFFQKYLVSGMTAGAGKGLIYGISFQRKGTRCFCGTESLRVGERPAGAEPVLGQADRTESSVPAVLPAGDHHSGGQPAACTGSS